MALNFEDLALLLASGAAIDQDLLIVLFCMQEAPRKHIQYRIDCFMLEDDVFEDMFRFEKDHVLQIVVALRFQEIRLDNRILVSGELQLLVLLRRLAYPCRLVELEAFFSMSRTTISRIVNHSLRFIHENHGHLLQFDSSKMTSARQECLAAAIHRKGAPLSNCVGFIDGTIRPMCRPTRNQKAFYNGHKRIHCLKFQSLVTPDGLIAAMEGGFRGARHDAGVFSASVLKRSLEDHLFGSNGRQMVIYGDPAYPLLPYLCAPFKGAVLTPEEQEFNRRMASVRIAVEWGFCKVLNMFAFVDYRKNLKLHLQPISLYYLVAAILTNVHTCLNGSQISEFFACDPPPLSEYIN